MKNRNYFNALTMLILCLGAWIAVPGFGQAGESDSRFSTQNNRQIAVLDFEQEGSVGISKYGGFAADELTTALFIKKKIPVVDRSQVKAKAAEKGIVAGAMSSKQIHDLGEELNADYLILGKIVFLNGQIVAPEAEEKTTFAITIRLLSTKDGSVAGMVNREESKKGNLENLIRELIRDMAGDVELKGSGNKGFIRKMLQW